MSIFGDFFDMSGVYVDGIDTSVIWSEKCG